MEISCVYIPEINEQEEDIIMAFRDIAKIEHIEFVVHNRYARVVRSRSNSSDFDSEKQIKNLHLVLISASSGNPNELLMFTYKNGIILISV